jgi:hypothetical protein
MHTHQPRAAARTRATPGGSGVPSRLARIVAAREAPRSRGERPVQSPKARGPSRGPGPVAGGDVGGGAAPCRSRRSARRGPTGVRSRPARLQPWPVGGRRRRVRESLQALGRDHPALRPSPALRQANRLPEALAGYCAYLREDPNAANRESVDARVRELEARATNAPAPEKPRQRRSIIRGQAGFRWAGLTATVALAGGAVAAGLLRRPFVCESP